MNRGVKICLVGVITATITATAAGSGPGEGLYGIVTKGPTAPTCRPEQPCNAPAQVTLVFVRTTPSGPKVYSVRSNTTGAYRVSLPSGYYTVTTRERVGITRNVRPHRIHVRRGNWDKINFFIDTGIR